MSSIGDRTADFVTTSGVRSERHGTTNNGLPSSYRAMAFTTTGRRIPRIAQNIAAGTRTSTFVRKIHSAQDFGASVVWMGDPFLKSPVDEANGSEKCMKNPLTKGRPVVVVLLAIEMAD